MAQTLISISHQQNQEKRKAEKYIQRIERRREENQQSIYSAKTEEYRFKALKYEAVGNDTMAGHYRKAASAMALAAEYQMKIAVHEGGGGLLIFDYRTKAARAVFEAEKHESNAIIIKRIVASGQRSPAPGPGSACKTTLWH